MKVGLLNILIGLVVAAIGLAVSFGSYEAVAGKGGTYYVAWGAVVFGALQALIGLVRVVVAVFTKEGRGEIGSLLWPKGALSRGIRLGVLVVAAAIGWLLAPESWKTVSPAPLRTFSVADDTNTIAYTPDSQWIAVADGYGGLDIFNVATGAEGKAPSLDAYQDVQAVAFSPDGKVLAAATSSGLRLWSSPDWGHAAPVLIGQAKEGNYAVAFSPDGKEVATGSVNHGALVWNAADASRLSTATNSNADVSAVAFSPDGSLLAAGDDGGSVILHKPDGTYLRTFDAEDFLPIHTLAFFRDGRLAVGGYEAPGVRIYDVADGKLLAKLEAPVPLFKKAGSIWSVAVSPDQSLIASGNSDNAVRIWDAKTYRLIRSIFGHKSDVTAVAYAPDGHTLASGSDHFVKIWANTP
ncbi:MAG: WD40 repeat domain-containing protein [Pseudomonadota bacterium]